MSAGKGDKRRPESRPGAFAEGHDQIDWSKRRPAPPPEKPTIFGFDVQQIHMPSGINAAFGDIDGFKKALHQELTKRVGLTEREAMEHWTKTTILELTGNLNTPTV